ncbi:MAG TPA: hypothetical protein PKU83_10125, partial [Chryseolinea sp.]|nr:hypothetical protein [Chryseolinea sp.]
RTKETFAREKRNMRSSPGTTTIMFNLLNHIDNKPYVDVVNMRFGFEFPMKKKQKVKPNS